jgi:hypothetical protein
VRRWSTRHHHAIRKSPFLSPRRVAAQTLYHQPVGDANLLERLTKNDVAEPLVKRDRRLPRVQKDPPVATASCLLLEGRHQPRPDPLPLHRRLDRHLEQAPRLVVGRVGMKEDAAQELIAALGQRQEVPTLGFEGKRYLVAGHPQGLAEDPEPQIQLGGVKGVTWLYEVQAQGQAARF